MKSGSSNKLTETLAKLLIDANGRRLHRFGGLVGAGFISEKTMSQISHSWGSRHVQTSFVQG